MKVQWECMGRRYQADVPDDAVPFWKDGPCPCHPGEGWVRRIDHDTDEYLCTVDGDEWVQWALPSPKIVWHPIPPVFYAIAGSRIHIHGIQGQDCP